MILFSILYFLIIISVALLLKKLEQIKYVLERIEIINLKITARPSEPIPPPYTSKFEHHQLADSTKINPV